MNEITTKFSVPGPNCTIRFYRGDGTVGMLDFNGPTLTFTGDADDSAKLFIDFLAEKWEARLIKERAEEREACAVLCDRLGVVHLIAKTCAAAIRARGEQK